MTEKNKNFIFGLVTGIAVIAIVGWIVTAAGDGDGTSSGGSKQAQEQGGSDNDLGDTGSADIVITKDDHIRGNFDAPVTIVEFSDFECPFCSRFHDTMKQVMEKYPNKVRWVYKHFPLDSIHAEARPAAEASECASEQGKFWEYADELVARQSSLGDSTYSAIARDIGLNIGQFEECYESGKYKNKVHVS